MKKLPVSSLFVQYGLILCPHWKFRCWKSNTQSGDGGKRWDLESWLGHESRCFLSGIESWKRGLRQLTCPFCHVRVWPEVCNHKRILTCSCWHLSVVYKLFSLWYFVSCPDTLRLCVYTLISELKLVWLWNKRIIAYTADVHLAMHVRDETYNR